MDFSRWRNRWRFTAISVVLFFLFSGFCVEINGGYWCVWNGNCVFGGYVDAGGGGGGEPSPTEIPTPTPTPTPLPEPTPVSQLYGIAGWTYKHEDCSQYKTVDPINLVLVIELGGITPFMVDEHSALHGSWTFHDGTDQSFWDANHCYSLHGQNASGQSFQFPGRFHLRYFIDHEAGLPFDAVAVVAAHHEDVSPNATPLCWHVVDHNEDNGGVSGFDMGRNDIMDNWGDAGHDILMYDFWNNTEPKPQCDGKDSWASGTVVFMNINE